MKHLAMVAVCLVGLPISGWAAPQQPQQTTQEACSPANANVAGNVYNFINCPTIDPELRNKIDEISGNIKALASEDPVLAGLERDLISAFNDDDQVEGERIAEQMAERAFKEAKKRSGVNSMQRYQSALLQVAVGDVKFQMSAYKSALSYFRQADDLLPKENEGRIPLWEMFESEMLLPRLVSSSMVMAQFQMAENYIERAMTMAKKQKSSPEVMAGIHVLKGQLHWQRGQMTEAETQYKQAREIYGQRLGPEHPWIIDLLLHTADINLARGEYEEADTKYQHALTVGERVAGSSSSALTGILAGSASSQILKAYRLLAGNHSELTNSDVARFYSTAEQNLERAIRYAETDKFFDYRRPGLVMVLAELGSVCRDQGRVVEAEAYLNLAHARMKNTLGEDHPLVADILQRLAIIYTDQGRFADADRNYKKALDIMRKTLGQEHFFVAWTMKNYAVLLRKDKRQAKADELLAQADAILRKHPHIRIPPVPPQPPLLQNEVNLHPNEVTQLLKGASIDYDENRWTEAQAKIKRAVIHLQTQRGHDTRQLADTLYGLGDAYRIDARFTQAESLLEHASELAEQENSSSDHVVGQMRRGLGYMLMLLKRYNDAELNFKQAIAALQRARGFEFIASYTANSLGDVYTKQKRYADAEALYKQALAVYKEVGNPEDENAAAPHHSLGRIYLRQKRYGEASVEFERALALRDNYPNGDYRSTVETLRLYAETLGYLDRKADAARFRERADGIERKHNVVSGDQPTSAIGR
jgi:tetratricopeptide (TPR) repeat protein